MIAISIYKYTKKYDTNKDMLLYISVINNLNIHNVKNNGCNINQFENICSKLFFHLQTQKIKNNSYFSIYISLII